MKSIVVNVTLRDSLKGVVQSLLREGKGPRDMTGMLAIMDNWQPGGAETYTHFMRAQPWTLGQLLSHLNWQTVYLNGDIDHGAFAQEWPVVAPLFKTLVTVQQLSAVLDAPTDVPTRAAALEF